MTEKIYCHYLQDTQVEIKKDDIKDILHTAHDEKQQYVTPGDMLVGALGACMLTMMGVVAQKNGEKLDGTALTLDPVFGAQLSGLQSLHIHITFPKHFTADLRQKCLAASRSCPVHKSLNPNIALTLTAE